MGPERPQDVYNLMRKDSQVGLGILGTQDNLFLYYSLAQQIFTWYLPRVSHTGDTQMNRNMDHSLPLEIGRHIYNCIQYKVRKAIEMDGKCQREPIS